MKQIIYSFVNLYMLEADDSGYTRSCWYDARGFWNLVWFENGVMRIEKNLECTNKYDTIQRVRIARTVCLERGLQFNERDLSCFYIHKNLYK